MADIIKPSQKPEAVAQSYVTVSIYDQSYHLSGPDLAQLRQLAAKVDVHMRAVAANGRTADSLRVAVLAALNLADELARAEEQIRLLQGSMDGSQSADLRIRAANLSELLDSVLEEDKAEL